MKRLAIGVSMLILLTSGIGFAGTVTSYVTNSGNAENEWVRYWGGGSNGTFWTGYDRNANNVAYGYSYYDGDGQETRTYTWLQVGLPEVSGNITSAMLYIDVLAGSSNSDNSGIYAALYHTINASSATGDATQGLGGDALVQNISFAGTGMLGLDVTSSILSDYSSHYSWAAFEFAPTAQAPYGSSFSFGLATPPTVAGDPAYLLITTDAGNGSGVPEPGTLSVAGLALFAFGLMSRRRKI
jgi:hypothetical protein